MIKPGDVRTISMSDYVGSKGKRLEDYDTVGVHIGGVYIDSGTTFATTPDERMARAAPLNSEAIVELRIAIAPGETKTGYIFSAHGTALIPKEMMRNEG